MVNAKSILRCIYRHRAVIGIILVSICLNTYNNEFPLGFHGDEGKKARFVAKGIEDFQHPLLMLQVGRIANFFSGYTDHHQVISVCRNMSALFGTLIVLLTYLLSRRVMTEGFARITALATAVSPILVMHAHYFKEDIFFTACALLSLYGYLRMRDKPGNAAIILFGISLGAAVAAQYKGALLLPVFVLHILFDARSELRSSFLRLLMAMVVAVPIVILINYPVISEFDIFLRGLDRSVRHLEKGHTLKLYPLAHYFSFHFFHSLIPGLTTPVVLVSLSGMALVFIARTKQTATDTLLFLYLLVFYLAHELTPLKPAPAFVRYMVPVAPALLFFCGRAMEALHRFAGSKIGSATSRRILYFFIVATIVIYPAIDSLLLTYHLTRDTRLVARDWINKSGEKAIFERYAITSGHDLRSLGQINPLDYKQKNIRYLVASSFMYERYLEGAKLKNQNQKVYNVAKRYEKLFQLPITEIQPRHRSFAFSNPVIRIIDLRGLDE